MRIMVVEDEELLQKGLISMIERMDLNCSIVASAANGEEALEQLAYLGVDLIITDIRMPRMDGLQLLEKVTAAYPHIRSIVLSGYDDFEYAKRAMKLNCKDYLLKPPLYNDLYNLLNVLQNEFVTDQVKSIADFKQREILNQNQYVIRHEFLKELINRDTVYQVESVIAKADNIGIRLQKEGNIVLALHLDEKHEIKRKYDKKDWGLMKYALHNIVEEFLDYAPCFYDEQEYLIVLYSKHQDLAQIDNICQALQTKINELLKMSVSIGISGQHDLADITKGAAEAKQVLKFRLVTDNSLVIAYSTVVASNHTSVKELMKELTELFGLDHAEVIIDRLKAWCERVQKAEHSLETLERIERELKVIFPALLRHHVKELGEDHYLTVNLTTAIENIEMADSIYAKTHPVINIIKEIESLRKRGKIEHSTSEQVMKYIKAHYHENITLSSISDKIYINPAYLSVMFKKKTGKSVIEFLTETRIEEAKKLLLDSEYKTYQIAEMVGYHDAAYFSNIFKKYNAVSPQEYRNSFS